MGNDHAAGLFGVTMSTIPGVFIRFEDNASDSFRLADQALRGLGEKVQWERALVEASMVMDRDIAEAYARRVGIETAGTAIDALADARRLAVAGLGKHVEATIRCPWCPLRLVAHKSRALGPTWLPRVDHVGTFYSVGSDVADALAATSWQVELRTPPNEWRAAPPMQLFEGTM